MDSFVPNLCRYRRICTPRLTDFVMLLTLSEAAALMARSPRALRYLIQKGKLPAIQKEPNLSAVLGTSPLPGA